MDASSVARVAGVGGDGICLTGEWFIDGSLLGKSSLVMIHGSEVVRFYTLVSILMSNASQLIMFDRIMIHVCLMATSKRHDLTLETSE
jgi:hypothetical protein